MYLETKSRQTRDPFLGEIRRSTRNILSCITLRYDN